MTNTQLAALDLFASNPGWRQPQNGSDGVVFSDLHRKGLLTRRRNNERTFEYQLNRTAYAAAQKLGIVPEK